MWHEINYRTEPKAFSNRVLISTALLEPVAKLIQGVDAVEPSDLLALSVLIEAAVLNEGLILGADRAYDDVTARDFVEEMNLEEHEEAAQDLLAVLGRGGAIESGIAANHLNHTLGLLAPVEEIIRIRVVHGSHIAYELVDSVDVDTDYAELWESLEEEKRVWANLRELEREEGQAALERELEEQAKRRERFIPDFSNLAEYDASYLQALKKHGYDPPDPSGNWEATAPRSVPWLLIASSHGIPYCSDPFYTAREVGHVPSSIGVDLYHRLEQLNQGFFDTLRRYLGPSYVRIPALLSIVLGQCRNRQDIPAAIIATRQRFSKLRKRCTRLEYDLRTAETIGEQRKVINEIENAFAAAAKKISKTKARISHRMFDIVKKIDPLRMGTAALDLAKEYDVEKQALLKLPGLFDMWSASREVEQALPQLERVFGDDLPPNVARAFQDLIQQLPIPTRDNRS